MFDVQIYLINNKCKKRFKLQNKLIEKINKKLL